MLLNTMFTKKRSCLKVVELWCICSKPTESKTWSSPLHKQIWPIKQTKFKVKTRVNKQCHLTVPTVHIVPLLTLQQTLNCDNVDFGASKLRTHQLLTCLRTKHVRTKLFGSQTQTSSFAAVRNPDVSQLVFAACFRRRPSERGDPLVTPASDDTDRRLDVELTEASSVRQLGYFFFKRSRV